MDNIRVFGTDYKCRYLEEGLIASEKLEEVLMKDGAYTSKKAQKIDEEIFCYLPDEILNVSNQDIREYIKRNIL